MYTKYCHYCGKTFETDHEDEEFCCLECAIAHARVYLETLLDLQEERKPREKKAQAFSFRGKNIVYNEGQPRKRT